MPEFKKIGRYVVESLLGEGAMGSVFKAHDPFIKRTVAIKIVKLDASANQTEADEFLERFKMEAQISGHLNHPSIVAIYDVGEEDGMPYIAMEYVEGVTLSDYIRRSPAPGPSDRMKVLTQIAGALDFAHAKGIVHRDLKPANIIVQNNGDPKIMDFGIAKMSGSNLTQTGIFLGTPSYSSPEQIKEGAVDYRSDIFSLGILAHETFTGVTPFRGSSINAILYKIANEPPAIAEDVHGLPVRLSVFREVMTRVLHKSPDKRYQKASDFTTALFRSLTLSQEEATVVGTVMQQMDARVREAAGVTRDLKRSEFEESMKATVALNTMPPTKKKSGVTALIMAVLLLAVSGGALYLHQTGRLMPLIDQLKGQTGVAGAGSTGSTGEPTTGETPTTTADQNVEPDKVLVDVEGEPESIQRSFSVNSTPTGARVHLGDAELGVTPLNHTWEGLPGVEQKLLVSKSGFRSKEQQLVLSETLPGSYNFELEAEPVSRKISSSPAGATVSLDGATLGKTPLSHDFLPNKSHHLTISKQGYKNQTVRYTEGKSSPDTLDVTLPALPKPGVLSVKSWLEGLTVSLDGRKRSEQEFTLPPGKYTLRLQAQRYYYDETREITVVEGETQEIKTPDVLTVKKVEFIGGYVNVEIDGMFVMNGSKKDITPMVNLRITAGKHEFKLYDTKSGKMVTTEIREVTDGEPLIFTASSGN